MVSGNVGDDGFDTRARLSTPRPQQAPPPPPQAGAPDATVAGLVEASRNCIEAVGVLSSRAGAAPRGGDAEEKPAGRWNDAMDALERTAVYRHPKYVLLQWGLGEQLAWPAQLDAFVRNPEEISNRLLRRKFSALAAGQDALRAGDLRPLEDGGARDAIADMILILMADTVLLDQGVAETNDGRAEAELRRRRGLIQRWTRSDDASTAREGTRALTRSFETGGATRTSSLALTAPAGEGGYRYALDDYPILAPGAARAEDEERDRSEKERRAGGGGGSRGGRGVQGGGAAAQRGGRGFGPSPGAGAKAMRAYEKNFSDAKRRMVDKGRLPRGTNKKCFKCNQPGHLQEQCPYKKLSREEARAKAAESDLLPPEHFEQFVEP
eukprot:gene43940-49007_t